MVNIFSQAHEESVDALKHYYALEMQEHCLRKWSETDDDMYLDYYAKFGVIAQEYE